MDDNKKLYKVGKKKKCKTMYKKGGTDYWECHYANPLYLQSERGAGDSLITSLSCCVTCFRACEFSSSFTVAYVSAKKKTIKHTT